VTDVPAALLASLRAAVGSPHVLTDPELTEGFSTDWTGRFHGRAGAVVRPGTTDEVEAVVRACAEAAVAIVPQGGNTGLVGGGVPLHGEVVLSLTRLANLDPVDVAATQVTAGAGVTLAELQRHADRCDLTFGVDLAPRDSCTIGGMVATNAGGTNVVRYGPMRAQVMGVEAVLGDGSVVSHLHGLPKDNTGYDLAGLLTGSEGTLGIVTAARLRLVPRPAHRVTAALGFAAIPDAVAAVGVLRSMVTSLHAAELVLKDGVMLVASVLGLEPPPALLAPAALILEAASPTDPTEEMAAAVARLSTVGDPVVATTPDQRRRLWAVREGHGEAINRLGPPVKLDVSVPLGRVAEFVAGLSACLPPGAGLVIFGHLGDGNLHVNVTGVLTHEPNAEEVARAEAVEASILEAVVGVGGSISAEHGIGTAKVRYLHLCRTPAEIAAFRNIKQALDPAGILNPHALLPALA
jgi:FAD/FMN-containing dehydrogenase